MINRTKLAWRHQIQLVQIKMQRYRRLQQQQAVQRYSLWHTLEYKTTDKLKAVLKDVDV